MSAPNRRICFEFARKGSCRFDPCRYAHVSQEEADKHGRSRTRRDFSELTLWKRQVDTISTRSFFAKARELIDGDEGTLQEVIQCLSRENGLRRIQELVQRDFDSFSATAKRDIFVNQMRPFIETITHPNVLASLVMESAVGTIYNFLYGVVGRRAGPFLGFLASAVQIEIETGSAGGMYLELSLLVFWKIVELNSTAFAQESFQPVAQRFADLFVALHALDPDFVSLHQSRAYLDKLQHRLDIGLSLPEKRDMQQNKGSNAQPAKFVTQKQPPGGRHDNDHADIQGVKIMPTLQEILSPRSEYLPGKDQRGWHLAGLAGLLDRNFRLLREDTVGQLRDAIHAELQVVDHKSWRQKGQARTNVYREVVVEAVDLHRFTGLQFLVRFAQSAPVRGSSKQKAQEWWNLSKRLQSDALVCLVDPRGSTFCIVAYPDRPRAQSDTAERHEKVTGSLSDDPHAASIVLQLVEPDQESWQYVLDCHTSRGGARPSRSWSSLVFSCPLSSRPCVLCRECSVLAMCVCPISLPPLTRIPRTWLRYRRQPTPPTASASTSSVSWPTTRALQSRHLSHLT